MDCLGYYHLGSSTADTGLWKQVWVTDPQRSLSKGRNFCVLPPLKRGRFQLAPPARESLFLAVCFISISHILDFFFFLALVFFFSPYGFGNMGHIRFIAQSIALVVGVGMERGQVFGSGLWLFTDTWLISPAVQFPEFKNSHREQSKYGMLKGLSLI